MAADKCTIDEGEMLSVNFIEFMNRGGRESGGVTNTPEFMSS